MFESLFKALSLLKNLSFGLWDRFSTIDEKKQNLIEDHYNKTKKIRGAYIRDGHSNHRLVADLWELNETAELYLPKNIEKYNKTLLNLFIEDSRIYSRLYDNLGIAVNLPGDDRSSLCNRHCDINIEIMGFDPIPVYSKYLKKSVK